VPTSPAIMQISHAGKYAPPTCQVGEHPVRILANPAVKNEIVEFFVLITLERYTNTLLLGEKKFLS